jgi:hypothetical protein
MGRSITPKYAVKIDQLEMTWHCSFPGCKCPRHGKPTAAKLATFVADFAKSLEAGGVNAHLNRAAPRSAVVYENKRGGSNIATWKA